MIILSWTRIFMLDFHAKRLSGMRNIWNETKIFFRWTRRETGINSCRYHQKMSFRHFFVATKLLDFDLGQYLARLSSDVPLEWEWDSFSSVDIFLRNCLYELSNLIFKRPLNPERKNFLEKSATFFFFLK